MSQAASTETALGVYEGDAAEAAPEVRLSESDLRSLWFTDGPSIRYGADGNSREFFVCDGEAQTDSQPEILLREALAILWHCAVALKGEIVVKLSEAPKRFGLMIAGETIDGAPHCRIVVTKPPETDMDAMAAMEAQSTLAERWQLIQSLLQLRRQFVGANLGQLMPAIGALTTLIKAALAVQDEATALAFIDALLEFNKAVEVAVPNAPGIELLKKFDGLLANATIKSVVAKWLAIAVSQFKARNAGDHVAAATLGTEASGTLYEAKAESEAAGIPFPVLIQVGLWLFRLWQQFQSQPDDGVPTV